jgi:outer membrane protein assembly factor BamB
MKTNLWIAIAIILSLTVSCSEFSPSDRKAKAILQKADIHGGLVVHAGCGDGKLTASFGKDEQFTVQGLDRDPASVKKAREFIYAKQQYGRISYKQWYGKKLPYTENLINILIVDDKLSAIPEDEIRRVLAPRGMAFISKDVQLKELELTSFSSDYNIYTKPVPDDIDEWTHYLHSPDNNAVARDTKVGPPKQMQWVCGPKYFRSHEINPSFAAMVTTGGRIFYILDEGPLGQPDERFPSNWSLIARDAFNGIQLWKRPMPDWGWRQWHAESRWEVPRDRGVMLWQMPKTTNRRLVASGSEIYVTLGYQAPVSILNAATGELIRTISGTEGTDEILLTDHMLLLCVREMDRPANKPHHDFRLSQNPGKIIAINLQDDRTLWESEKVMIAQLSLAYRNDHVYYASEGQVICLDGTSGERRWKSEAVPGSGNTGTLVAHDEVVLYTYGPVPGEVKRGYQTVRYHQAHAFSTDSGEKLWSSNKYRGASGNSPDIFFIHDLVWLGVDDRENLPDHWQETTTQRVGYDPLSGEKRQMITVPELTSPGHHYRCYRSKATERFLLLPKRGVEFLDLQGSDHMRHDWLRAPCSYGVMPANGILYTAPHPCVCYQGVLMSDFHALTAQPDVADPTPEKEVERLNKGPKYGTIKNLPQVIDLSDNWPMYRHDTRRSGYAESAVPDLPAQQWGVTLKAPITPPVAADGKIFIVEKDAHTVHALDAETGHSIWRYTAGARVDSPPTLYGPLALFGSADGYVYCLDASDGSEIWRFLAAPTERQISAFGQMESTWPVHGSVLVHKDITQNPPRPLVYFTAGRSTYLDGGIYVYALDPLTGEVQHETLLDGPWPDPFTEPGGAGYIDGAKSDILVSDGVDLFLLQERFRSDLVRFPAPMQQLEREWGGYREYPTYPDRGSNGMRLLATRGFLDDSYNEGTYWALSQRWPGWDRHMNHVGAWGQLMVFNETTVFGLNVFYNVIRVRRGFFPGTKGYRLFAKEYEPGKSEEAFKNTKDKWSAYIPIRVRAMVLAKDKLFVAGPPDVIPEEDPLAAFEGRMGADLWAISATTGEKLAEIQRLNAPPVYDGLIAAYGCLYLSTLDGRVQCFGK